MMSAGEWGPAAQIPLVAHNIINHASQFVAQREQAM